MSALCSTQSFSVCCFCAAVSCERGSKKSCPHLSSCHDVELLLRVWGLVRKESIILIVPGVLARYTPYPGSCVTGGGRGDRRAFCCTPVYVCCVLLRSDCYITWCVGKGRVLLLYVVCVCCFALLFRASRAARYCVHIYLPATASNSSFDFWPRPVGVTILCLFFFHFFLGAHG